MIKSFPVRMLPILPLLLFGSFAEAQDAKSPEALATVNGLRVSLGYDGSGKVLVIDLHNTSVHDVGLGYNALELQSVYALIGSTKIQAAEAFPLPPMSERRLAPNATASGRVRLPVIGGITNPGSFWCYAGSVQLHDELATIDLCIPARN